MHTEIIIINSQLKQRAHKCFTYTASRKAGRRFLIISPNCIHIETHSSRVLPQAFPQDSRISIRLFFLSSPYDDRQQHCIGPGRGRASSSLPFVSPITYVDGVPMLDGGIVDSIPVEYALNQGFDKLVIVLTRNRGYRKP